MKTMLLIIKYTYLSVILSIWIFISYKINISVDTIYNYILYLYYFFGYSFVIRRFFKQKFDLPLNLYIDFLIFILGYFIVIFLVLRDFRYSGIV